MYKAILMKHAFLIIAHNEFEILRILLSMLDDERNDIFLHIDKKVDLSSLSRDLFQMDKARLYVLQQRINVRWGDLSVVETELLLFDTASMQGPYDYYHLLSGVDLPIKSQDYIHDFFEKNKGFEFVAYSSGENNQKDLEWKVSKYHFFPQYYQTSTRFGRKWVAPIRQKLLKLQDLFHFSRSKDMVFKKGTNWVSITHDLVMIILEKREFIQKRFKYVLCGDEIFLHSILWNSSHRDRIYPTKGNISGGVREIDWQRGGPYVWKIDDLPCLLKSGNLFARKFSSDDMEIVMQIKENFGVKK